MPGQLPTMPIPMKESMHEPIPETKFVSVSTLITPKPESIDPVMSVPTPVNSQFEFVDVGKVPQSKHTTLWELPVIASNEAQ